MTEDWDDPTDPARGILLAVVLGCLFYAAVFAVIFAVLGML